MTETDKYISLNVKYTCRTCLRTSGHVREMTTGEINLYENMLNDHNIRDYIYICTYCAHYMKKCSKFINQCRIANNFLRSVLQNERKSKPIVMPSTMLAYDLNISKIEQHNYYELDEQILEQHDGINLTNSNSNCNYNSIFDDDVFADADELPLVMLKNNDKVFVVEKRRKRKKRGVKSDLIQENNALPEIKSENGNESQDLINEQGKFSKRKKILREGFSSRMVQETEEYLVIKLSKDQVLKEMEDKSKTEKYVLAPFKCEKCVKGFNFEDVLQTHMEKHSMERGPYQCDICFQYCPSLVSLRGHIKSHTTRYKCKVCGDVRMSRQHLLEHHVINHIPNAVVTYNCDHCVFSTNKRTVIQRHLKTHATTEKHACDKCGKLFKNIESLRVHTIRHDKSKRVECEHCQRKFIYPSMLNKHVQSVHVNKDYYCVECDVKFKSPENLRLHFKKAKRHRDSSSFKHACPQCEQRFISTSTLSVHLSAAHGAPKQHRCTLCSQVYSSRDTLRCHVNRVHRERQIGAVCCHICSKKFSSQELPPHLEISHDDMVSKQLKHEIKQY